MAGSAIGGLIGGGISLLGANKAANAAKDAARLEAGASREALDLQREIFETTRQDYAPYRETGANALDQLAALLGLKGGDLQQNAFSQFQETPGYQFGLDQGVNAIDRSAASRGMLNSGRTLKELQRFGQGYADQEFNNYLNRLAGTAGVGQSSTNALAQVGQNFAGQAGNSLQNIGAAQAGGVLGSAGAWNQGIQNALQFAAYGFGNQGQGQPQNALQQWMGGAGGGGATGNPLNLLRLAG